MGPPHSSLLWVLEATRHQELAGLAGSEISVLPAEAQDPALKYRRQEGTQKQNLLLWKGVESSLGRKKLSYLETKKEVHVHMQGEPED